MVTFGGGAEGKKEAGRRGRRERQADWRIII